MKAHTTIAICLATLLTAHVLGAPTSLLDKRGQLEAKATAATAEAAANPSDTELAAVAAARAQDLTEFDGIHAAKFGPDWVTRWQDSEYKNPDDEAVDLYIGGKDFTWSFSFCSTAKQRELLDHIAAKPAVTATDTQAVMQSSATTPAIADRLEDLAAHLPSGNIRNQEYFVFKHISLLKKSHAGVGPVRGFVRHMSTEEWLDLASASAHFPPATFGAMRNHLLAHATRLLIEKRRAAGLPLEGPEFDAAIAPVVDALKAPMFNGLAAAVAALEIDLAIPTPDYAAQEAVAAAVEFAAANRTTFITPWGTTAQYPDGLGSVMFVKGEAAYAAWRESLINSN